MKGKMNNIIIARAKNRQKISMSKVTIRKKEVAIIIIKTERTSKTIDNLERFGNKKIILGVEQCASRRHTGNFSENSQYDL